jgi:mRNA-degrading endonuclease RelE of RelBE toxin-antitoxin system
MAKVKWHPDYVKALKELKKEMRTTGKGLPTIIKEREANRRHFDVSVRTLYRRIKKV